MTAQDLVHGPGDAFVQQDSHAADGIKACSERSNTWRANSRLTDGKHSRNSSSE